MLEKERLLTVQELDLIKELSTKFEPLQRMIEAYEYLVEHPEAKVQVALNASVTKIMNMALSGNVSDEDGTLKAYILIAEKMGAVLKNIKETKKSVMGEDEVLPQGKGAKFVPKVTG